ncbi:hypothetical protein NPIL_281571 [Nephila pilipes]|uniref:Uncharacterized protein n=1 Tax=Nephila pilipes TaxID=299642 RepID=A0A8X6UBJ1_NEPPI|nr:hypothetical protein NPIL_281571 [Nephila pilipes]
MLRSVKLIDLNSFFLEVDKIASLLWRFAECRFFRSQLFGKKEWISAVILLVISLTGESVKEYFSAFVDYLEIRPNKGNFLQYCEASV